MILKLTIFNWRFTFSCAPITRVVGVNSILPNGNHVLMWDFDDVSLNSVVSVLSSVQRIYQLPDIYILETKAGKNYIAYSLKEVTWRKAVEIITFTEGVDYNFIKYGIYRNKFTLRVTPKCGRKPKLVYTLRSLIKEDATIKDLKSWVQYETLPDNFKQQKVELQIGAKEEA